MIQDSTLLNYLYFFCNLTSGNSPKKSTGCWSASRIWGFPFFSFANLICKLISSKTPNFGEGLFLSIYWNGACVCWAGGRLVVLLFKIGLLAGVAFPLLILFLIRSNKVRLFSLFWTGAGFVLTVDGVWIDAVTEGAVEEIGIFFTSLMSCKLVSKFGTKFLLPALSGIIFGNLLSGMTFWRSICSAVLFREPPSGPGQPSHPSRVSLPPLRQSHGV